MSLLNSTSEQVVGAEGVSRPTVLLTICDSRSRTALDDFNVGNRLFVHACARHLQFDMEINDLSIRPKIGKLLLPFPNFIRENDDLRWLEEFILETDAQSVVLLCGGIQSDIRRKLYLPDGAVRALRLISERSAALGVRGYYTAEVLADHGLHNVEVVGCPSLHWWMSPDFGKLSSPSGGGIVVHTTTDGNFSNELAELYAFSIMNDANYVLQTEFYYAGLLGAEETPIAQSHLNWILENYRSRDISKEDFCGWISRRACHFTDPETWIKYFQDKSFSIGTRLHGSIAAILAGRPARILWHDERVREVAEFHGIPSSPFRGQSRESIGNMIPRPEDMEPFRKRYSDTFENYVTFLRKNDLSLSLPLARCFPA